MRRVLLILAAAASVAACESVPGFDPGATMTNADRYEQQERIRRQVEQRQQMCRALDPESDRYKRECVERSR
jgi:hypothetical protein